VLLIVLAVLGLLEPKPQEGGALLVDSSGRPMVLECDEVAGPGDHSP
jgi:hypothetical protein